MKSHVIAMAFVLSVVFAVQANATYVSVASPDNLAASATWRTDNDLILDKATDGKIPDAVPGPDPTWEEGLNLIYSSPSASYNFYLTWAKAVNLTSLQAYVCHGDTEGSKMVDPDRLISQVSFYVDQGAGYLLAGTVNTADTDDVGVFDLTKLDGSWSNVTSVRYDFVASSASEPPRVAEVLAIGTVPEPSTMALVTISLLSLLAYAWRKRR